MLAFSGLVNLAQEVSTVSGKVDRSGWRDGVPDSVLFNNPHGITRDREGNFIVCDRFNHVIRKIDTNGVVSTIAGAGVSGFEDGNGEEALFYEPWDVITDAAGNIFVADAKNNAIRKIDKQGNVSTYAGTGAFGMTDSPNPAISSFGWPSGFVFGTDSILYVADHLTHLIRGIRPNGAVFTLAGNGVGYPNNHGATDGVGLSASFYRPYGLALSNEGDILVADEWNSLIRKVTPEGVVTTVAGTGVVGHKDGPSNESQFDYVWDMVMDPSGNIYVGDGYNHVVRAIDPFGNVSTLAGTLGVSAWKDGSFDEAQFSSITGIIYVEEEHSLYLTCSYNDVVRKIELAPFASFQSSDTLCINEGVGLSVIPLDYDDYWIHINDTAYYALESVPDSLLRDSVNVLLAISLSGDTIGGPHTVYKQLSNRIDISGPDSLEFCLGDTVEFSLPQGQVASWNAGGSQATVSVSSSTLLYASSNDYLGCNVSTDTLILRFNQAPVGTIVVDSFSFRETGEVPLYLDSPLLPAWNTGEKTDTIFAQDQAHYFASFTNSQGCTGYTDTVQVFFPINSGTHDCFVPNGFSPNADGVNDEFVCSGISFDEDPTLEIFNRWGEKILERTDYQNDWTGNLDDGTPLVEGTYYYTLKGKTIKTNGYVVIKR